MSFVCFSPECSLSNTTQTSRPFCYALFCRYVSFIRMVLQHVVLILHGMFMKVPQCVSPLFIFFKLFMFVPLDLFFVLYFVKVPFVYCSDCSLIFYKREIVFCFHFYLLCFPAFELFLEPLSGDPLFGHCLGDAGMGSHEVGVLSGHLDGLEEVDSAIQVAADGFADR